MNNSDEKKETHIEEDFNEKHNELRNTFANAMALNSTLEAKASTFFGFSALIISVILFTLNSILSPPLKGPITNFEVQLTFYLLIIVVILLIGWGLLDLWNVVKLRIYSFPFSYDPNKIFQIVEKTSEEFRKEIINDYKLCIPNHTCINDKKKDLLNNGINKVSIGFVASVIIMLILIGIKMIGGTYG